MKRIVKALISFGVVMVLVMTQFSSVFAIGLTKSTNQVSPGGQFTITVSGLSQVRGKFNVGVNNGSGSTSFYANGNDSYSFSITAGSSGTVTVSVVAEDAYTLSEEEVKWSSSTNVQISTPSSGGNTPSSGGSTPSNPTNRPSNSTNSGNNDQPSNTEDTRSQDNSLSSLTVSEGTLSPEFNKDILEYNLSLSSKVSKLIIGASATDTKSVVEGLGEKELVIGENDFEITVTAENQSVRKYLIKVMVDETPTVYLKYGKNKLGVVKNLRELTVPTGFEETKVIIDGEEVIGWYNPTMKKTILYLINEKNEKNFYLYDKGVTSFFVPIALLGRNVYMVDIPKDKQEIEGMIFQEVTIEGMKLKGWKFKDKEFSNYSLISVMNEQGKMIYYQYESTENTLQLFSNSAPITIDEYQNTKKYKTYTTIASGVCVVLGIIAIAMGILCINYKKANGKIVSMITESN